MDALLRSIRTVLYICYMLYSMSPTPICFAKFLLLFVFVIVVVVLVVAACYCFFCSRHPLLRNQSTHTYMWHEESSGAVKEKEKEKSKSSHHGVASSAFAICSALASKFISLVDPSRKLRVNTPAAPVQLTRWMSVTPSVW